MTVLPSESGHFFLLHPVLSGLLAALPRPAPHRCASRGASEVNQLNRIKLMLSSARRAMQGGAAQDAEALPIAR